MEASQTRDRTCVPCIARWLNHWATREVPRLANLIRTSKNVEWLELDWSISHSYVVWNLQEIYFCGKIVSNSTWVRNTHALSFKFYLSEIYSCALVAFFLKKWSGIRHFPFCGSAISLVASKVSELIFIKLGQMARAGGMCMGVLYGWGLKGHTSLPITSHWQGLSHIVRAKSEGCQEIQSGHVPRKMTDCLGE